jgi:hypothetical protein
MDGLQSPQKICLEKLMGLKHEFNSFLRFSIGNGITLFCLLVGQVKLSLKFCERNLAQSVL